MAKHLSNLTKNNKKTSQMKDDLRQNDGVKRGLLLLIIFRCAKKFGKLISETMGFCRLLVLGAKVKYLMNFWPSDLRGSFIACFRSERC